MSDILLGSETWQITVSCSVCGKTEIMYVPTDLDTDSVRRFLIGRGWLAMSGGVWLCPNDDNGHKP